DGLGHAAPPDVSPPPGLSRAHESPFVGRRAELNRLRASWGGVQMHGDRRIVLIAGEPGVGKTRLAHALGAGALAGNATVLRGRGRCSWSASIATPRSGATRRWPPPSPSCGAAARWTASTCAG